MTVFEWNFLSVGFFKDPQWEQMCCRQEFQSESTESMLLVFMRFVDNKKNIKHFQPNQINVHCLYLIFWQNSSQTLKHYSLQVLKQWRVFVYRRHIRLWRIVTIFWHSIEQMIEILMREKISRCLFMMPRGGTDLSDTQLSGQRHGQHQGVELVLFGLHCLGYLWK